MDIFQSTLSQTVFLFSLIIIGYILGKRKFIPEQSSTVLAKFENIVFLPALILNTFIESFTVDQLVAARDLMLVSFAIILHLSRLQLSFQKSLQKINIRKTSMPMVWYFLISVSWEMLW